MEHGLSAVTSTRDHVPMNLLVDLASRIPPAAPTDTGEEVFKRFRDEPDTMAICVVDDRGAPLGLIERNAFLVQMAAQHGYALFARRPVTRLMKSDPLTAEGEVTVAEFCDAVLQDRPSELLHGFIVTDAGRYLGVGSMLSLLQASAAMAAQASDQARDALAVRSQFLAVMSHEIRTPLNGVLGVAEVLRRQCEQDELQPLISTIANSGVVLGRLLDDALELSSGGSRLELDAAPFQASALAHEARSLWMAQADTQGVELRVLYKGDADVTLIGDAVRLAQVLNNLLSNALKFTEVGMVELRVSVEPGASDDVTLSIQVADTGPGIARSLRDTIFSPFQQTDEAEARGGSGLGLAVTQQLAELMGGSLRLVDHPFGGACFRFEVDLPTAEAGLRPIADGEAARPLHVLVADDHPTNLLVAVNLCEAFGCTTETASDGEAALAKVARGRFDLVLMDIRMPRMDGVEAARRIRALPDGRRDTPIIAVTANAANADAQIYKRAGIDGLVAKPVEPAALLEAINAIVPALASAV